MGCDPSHGPVVTKSLVTQIDHDGGSGGMDCSSDSDAMGCNSGGMDCSSDIVAMNAAVVGWTAAVTLWL